MFLGLTKFYKINDLVFQVDYQSDFEVFLVHPKFSHLEVKKYRNLQLSL